MPEQKIVDLTRTLYDLTSDYPELIPVLQELGLEGAGNAILRKTVGRKLAVAEALQKHNISAAEVERKLTAKGFRLAAAGDPVQSRRARREQLKEIIRDIHRQGDPLELRERFKDLLQDVGATEIAQLEQELIQEGLPETEIKSLCDVHAAVFEAGLSKQVMPEQRGGHPIHTFKKENRAIEKIVDELSRLFDRLEQSIPAGQDLAAWRSLHGQLSEVEKHYSRKENILFAYLEKHGVSGPPKVMWAVHDDIRALLKEVSRGLAEPKPETEELRKLIRTAARPVLKAITDMIYKEENIMFPMSLETLTEGEWAAVAEQSGEIGYCLVQPDIGWVPLVPPEPAVRMVYDHQGEHAFTGPESEVEFETGVLTRKQINLLLNHLPVDITFVDEHDQVRYFSQGKERIFQRSKAIIGREVQNCHPPDSVHIVNKILEDFRSGRRDSANFWLNMGEQYVYIQYYALRDEAGQYAGTIEVTQDIKGIQQIKGEKRIDSEGD